MRMLIRIILTVVIAISAPPLLPELGGTALARKSNTVELRKRRNLRFGSIIADRNRGGRVIISTDGTRICNAPLLCLGPSQAAKFRFIGRVNHGFSISLPAEVTLTGPNGAMKLVDITSSAPGFNNQNPRFSVGGTLVVKPNQRPGSYRGNLTITTEFE